ncbi:hypothetical protein L3X38_036971 [Prunus dulcis]|uniref:Integrase catalytic domain-containing protein n=1 Tax=Prunus dulcis TaxID=3755 RepID=A0AAD4V2G7_PRUDU|nr:hypothetical protein L3X38_036971 [Prunus dulcis]
MGIRLVNSTPYYPQSNGQAEESNKVIKCILKKMIKERPRAWYDLLPKTIWAYRNSKVRLSQRQIKKDYRQAMSQELEDLQQIRIDAHNLSKSWHRYTTNTSSKRLSLMPELPGLASRPGSQAELGVRQFGPRPGLVQHSTFEEGARPL